MKQTLIRAHRAERSAGKRTSIYFSRTTKHGLLAVFMTALPYQAFANSIAFVNATATVDNFAYSDAQVGWTQEITDGSFISAVSALANNPGGTYLNATASSSAYADLATGRLGVAGYALRHSTSTANKVQGKGLAWFGDSFTTFDQNGLFSWSGSDTASFSMTLTGQINKPSWWPGGWQLGLTIYNPGTLGATFEAIGGCGWSNGGLDWCSGVAAAGAPSGDLFSSLSLDADIMPGGDFDWGIMLTANETIPAPYNIEVDVDLSHTLSVGYTGPNGTYTISDSGVFPGTQGTVPEPTTLALMTLGLVGTGFRRKRQA